MSLHCDEYRKLCLTRLETDISRLYRLYQAMWRTSHLFVKFNENGNNNPTNVHLNLLSNLWHAFCLKSGVICSVIAKWVMDQREITAAATNWIFLLTVKAPEISSVMDLPGCSDSESEGKDDELNGFYKCYNIWIFTYYHRLYV